MKVKTKMATHRQVEKCNKIVCSCFKNTTQLLSRNVSSLLCFVVLFAFLILRFCTFVGICWKNAQQLCGCSLAGEVHDTPHRTKSCLDGESKLSLVRVVCRGWCALGDEGIVTLQDMNLH